MTVRAATSMIVGEESVFFTDRDGNYLPGTIVRETPDYSLYPYIDSPAHSENRPSSSLGVFRFSAISADDSQKVGELCLSIREDCYDGEAQRFIWIEELNDLNKRKLEQVGISLIEKAIKESLTLNLEGRVKVLPLLNLHLSYLDVGFVPEKVQYTYSNCIAITRFLRRFFQSKEWLQEFLSTLDPLFNEARNILAIEHRKTPEEIDSDFIHSHWYWDQHYPLKIVTNYISWIKKTKEAPHSPKSYLYVHTVSPMMMHLPKKSLEIWKKIITIPTENHADRLKLFQQLQFTEA